MINEIGEIAYIISGYAFESNMFNDNGNGIPLVRIRDVGQSRSNTFYSGDYRREYLLSNGDLIIGMDGEFRIAEWNGGKALLNQRVCKIQPIESKVLSKYLLYLLPKELKKIENVTPFVTVKHLSVKSIKHICIHLPPLDIQEKITTILDAADDLKQKDKALIAKYDELSQSLFLDMFGDPVTNPHSFKIVTLDDVTTKISDGVHLKPKYTEDGVPFISVKDITTGKLIFDDCKYISEESHIKYTKRVKPEYMDILYTKVGATYGRPAIIDQDVEFSIYVSVALIKPMKEIINPFYLKEALANPAIKRQADRSIKGIGVPDLHLNMIKKFIIPLPDMSLQNQFAECIQSIEKQNQQAKASLKKSEELFDCLLQKAFKGELVT